MALYRRGRYWWVSMWRGGRHIQVSTRLTEKRKARAVEQALSVAGRAKDGSGRVLTVGTDDDGCGMKNVVLGLLRSVYGDDRDATELDSVWEEYVSVLKVKGKVVTDKNLRDKKSCLDKFSEWAAKEGVRYVRQVDGQVARRYALLLAGGGMSGKRRKNVIRHLSAAWNAMLPNHRGMVNPWPVVSPSNVEAEERAVFTAEEERKVMEASRRIHPQWYVASMIARHTGLRYGDVCRMTYGQVDLEDRMITVRPHKTEHTSGVEVTVPICGALMSALSEWAEANPGRRPDDRVLPWLREYGPKDDRRFSRVLTAAGLDPKRYSFHTWRHTFRTALAKAGVTNDVAMKLCGHTTAEMSHRYDHSRITSSMREAVEMASAAG